MRSGTWTLAAGLVFTAGCSDGDATGDSAVTAVVGPCAGGGWGAIGDPDAAIHVRSDGSDETGDGSLSAPYATLGAGLAASRAAGASPVAVGPGSFQAGLVLSDDSGDGSSDDGLALEGCGATETTLTGDDSDSLIRVVGVQELRLAGLGLEGGRRTLWLRAGTIAGIEDLSLTGATRLGLVVDGSSTLVDAERLTVTDTLPETLSSGASMGYGISVDGGSLVLRDGVVDGSTGVGILAAFATLDLAGVQVNGTLAGADGTLGRGVQLQELSLGLIADTSLRDNQDAALFATRAVDLQVTGLTVETVAAGLVPGQSDTTGDGIVVTQGAAGDSDPADFTATLHDCLIDGTARAAVLLDGVTADLEAHTHQDNGLVVDGSSTISQGETVLSGSVAAAVVDADSELLINHQAVELDDYTD